MVNIARGFSFIEMLVVIAILSFLALLALPVAETVELKTREKLLREHLQEMRTAIEAYRTSNRLGLCPPSIDTLLASMPDSDLLASYSFPGPFLSRSSVANPWLSPQGSSGDPAQEFVWDLRVYDSGNWSWKPADPLLFAAPQSVCDVRFPAAGIGGWNRSPFDQTALASW